MGLHADTTELFDLLDISSSSEQVDSERVLSAVSFARFLQAVLSAQLADDQVESTYDRLAELGHDQADSLAQADSGEISPCLPPRSARESARIARLLQHLAHWYRDTFGDRDPDECDFLVETLREGLRSVRGVGPVLVERLLLDGLERPVAVIDRGTFRILVRHGWVDADQSFDEVRELVEEVIAGRWSVARQLHSQLAEVGRTDCRATRPQCTRCRLQSLLPEGGPIEPE